MMRSVLLLPLLALWICVCARSAHAQSQSAPPVWIGSVPVDAVDRALTITGSGLSETCEITLDGHPATMMAGGSATRRVVLVPPAVLAAPGSYRLTVVDPVRRLSDAFEVSIADRGIRTAALDPVVD